MPRQRTKSAFQASSFISRPSGANQAMSLTSAADARPWKNLRRRSTGCGQAQVHELADELAGTPSARSSGSSRASVSLVVLAVGVVVALLRVAELVAGADHRHALREQQRGHEVPLLPLAQRA